MAIDLNNTTAKYNGIRGHVGHELMCVEYGEGENVAIQCETCGEILVEENRPEFHYDPTRHAIVDDEGTAYAYMSDDFAADTGEAIAKVLSDCWK